MKVNKILMLGTKVSAAFLVGLVFINMGGGVSKNEASSSKIVVLEKGEPSYVAKITTIESNVESIRDLSIGGKTMISGIKRESDGAEIQINIANYKEFVVVDSHYVSNKFGGAEFIKVDGIPSSPKAKVVNGLLFPRNVAITGKSRDGSYDLSLELWKIKNVKILGIREIVESEGNGDASESVKSGAKRKLEKNVEELLKSKERKTEAEATVEPVK